jgi:cell shape-determining protein MreC
VQLSDLERSIVRFEQQLQSFETLHGGELQTLKQQLEAIQQIQQDELQMLREQLQQLKENLAAYKAAEEKRTAGQDTVTAVAPVAMTVTRRDLLTGRVFGTQQKQS